VAEIAKPMRLAPIRVGRAAPGLTSLKQSLEECAALVRGAS